MFFNKSAIVENLCWTLQDNCMVHILRLGMFKIGLYKVILGITLYVLGDYINLGLHKQS